MKFAEEGRVFALAFAGGFEAGGPEEATVEGADDEGDADLAAAGGE